MATSKQASEQTYTHTHVHNAVPLVWGEPERAPITHCKIVFILSDAVNTPE